jgi:hypothetical protein
MLSAASKQIGVPVPAQVFNASTEQLLWQPKPPSVPSLRGVTAVNVKVTGMRTPPLPDEDSNDQATKPSIAEASRALLMRAIAEKLAARAKGNDRTMPPPLPRAPSCAGGSIQMAKGKAVQFAAPLTS